MPETDIETEFKYRTEPIVLEPGKICKYLYICIYKQPDCHGASGERDGNFVCDINTLKKIKMLKIIKKDKK